MEGKIIIACIFIAILFFGIGFYMGASMVIKKGITLYVVMSKGGIINMTYDTEVVESLFRRYINSAQLN